LPGKKLDTNFATGKISVICQNC